jgi:hypothetical protein
MNAGSKPRGSRRRAAPPPQQPPVVAPRESIPAAPIAASANVSKPARKRRPRFVL